MLNCEGANMFYTNDYNHNDNGATVTTCNEVD